MTLLFFSPSRILLAAFLACVVTLGLPVLGISESKAALPAKPALTVTTVLPSAAEWPHYITASGSITAWQEAIIGSEVGGLRLTEVQVNVGDHVRKGQELARLQSDTVSAEREQTRASMVEAKVAFAESQSNANRARQIEASGALSAQQFMQYLTAELTAKARVDVLKAKLKMDNLRLSQTRILAPDTGTISARTATLGAVVQPGQELFRLIRRDRLEWRAEVPAADLVLIKVGMAVTLTSASKSKVSGRVRMVGPTLDPRTRNGLVYVDLDDNGDASAGMFASGEVELPSSKVLALPQRAVLLRDGFSYVFRIGADNRVIQTKVGVGQRSGDLVAITGGLESGMAVVANGLGFLADGDLVRIVASSAPAAAARKP